MRTENLHGILGSIEVARTMIGRSTTLAADADPSLLTALDHAADALAAVARTVDQALKRPGTLGPAA